MFNSQSWSGLWAKKLRPSRQYSLRWENRKLWKKPVDGEVVRAKENIIEGVAVQKDGTDIGDGIRDIDMSHTEADGGTKEDATDR